MESTALQAHQLYCIDLSVRRNRSLCGPLRVFRAYGICPCLRVGPSLPHLNPLSFLKEINKSSIGFIKFTTKVEENRNRNYAMEFKNSHVRCNGSNEKIQDMSGSQTKIIIMIIQLCTYVIPWLW
jgi:hypothetical protein